MSNLIPSLDTFAKAGRRRVLLPSSAQVLGSTRSALLRGVLFESDFLMACELMIGFLLYNLGDCCDGCGIGHAGLVLIHPSSFV